MPKFAGAIGWKWDSCFLVWIALLALIAGGCTGNRVYPVEGKVIFKDGTPYVGGGQVNFEPMDKTVRTAARGILKADGTFRMGTYQDTDGVPEGRYRVVVVPTPPRSLRRPPPDWPPFHKRYSQPDKSKLEFDVTAGPNAFTIVVEK
jgi:hypothetical protein